MKFGNFIRERPFFILAIIIAGWVWFIESVPGGVEVADFFISEKSGRVFLCGAAASEPEFSSFYGAPVQRFLFKADGVRNGDGWKRIDELVKASIQADIDEVNYGDILLLEGEIERPWTRNSKEGFDYREYLARRNIHFILKTGRKDTVVLLGVEPSLKRMLLSFKKRIRGIIFRNIQGVNAAVLSAMILGDRYLLPEYIRKIFVETGTVHILAISGLHSGLAALIFIAIFRIIRIEIRLSYILTGLLLWFYVIMTGGRPSVVRAVIIASLILAGKVMDREVDIFNALGVAALILLFNNSGQLFDAGFQLSFAAIISICAFAPRIEKIFKTENYYLRNFLIKPFAVSLAACAGTMPIVLYHFHILTPVSVFANLVVIPMLFFVIANGFAVVIFGSFIPVLGKVFGATEGVMLDFLLQIAGFFNKVPFGHFYF